MRHILLVVGHRGIDREPTPLIIGEDVEPAVDFHDPVGGNHVAGQGPIVAGDEEEMSAVVVEGDVGRHGPHRRRPRQLGEATNVPDRDTTGLQHGEMAAGRTEARSGVLGLKSGHDPVHRQSAPSPLPAPHRRVEAGAGQEPPVAREGESPHEAVHPEVRQHVAGGQVEHLDHASVVPGGDDPGLGIDGQATDAAFTDGPRSDRFGTGWGLVEPSDVDDRDREGEWGRG